MAFLILIAILVLTISSAFLFADQNNHPIVNYGLAGFVSSLCGAFIWITTEGIRKIKLYMKVTHAI